MYEMQEIKDRLSSTLPGPTPHMSATENMPETLPKLLVSQNMSYHAVNDILSKTKMVKAYYFVYRRSL